MTASGSPARGRTALHSVPQTCVFGSVGFWCGLSTHLPAMEYYFGMRQDLEPIASLRISKAIEQFTEEAQRMLEQTRNQMAARGAILSGNAEQAEFDIQAGTLEKVAHTIADTWVDLLTKRNQKLTRDDPTLIMQKVEGYTSVQVRNLGS